MLQLPVVKLVLMGSLLSIMELSVSLLLLIVRLMQQQPHVEHATVDLQPSIVELSVLLLFKIVKHTQHQLPVGSVAVDSHYLRPAISVKHHQVL